MNTVSKFFIGIKRKIFTRGIPYVNETKRFGNNAEEEIGDYIRKALPKGQVKTNILLETNTGRGEIDCLVNLDSKLFIIEIKHWKGIIEEKDDRFYSFKKDKYTNEIHAKEVKSPFSQINRQVRLLKEMTNSNPWINKIVFFIGADEIRIKQNENKIWFDNIHQLVIYLYKNGRKSYPNQIKKCFSKIKSSDYISSSSIFSRKNLNCQINDETLSFKINNRLITKKDISSIRVNHRFSSDELEINLKSNEKIIHNEINKKIIVYNNGKKRKYSLAKIDNIVIGN